MGSNDETPEARRLRYRYIRLLMKQTVSIAGFIAACASLAYLVGFLVFNVVSGTLLGFTDLSISSVSCMLLAILVVGVLCCVAILTGVTRLGGKYCQKQLETHPRRTKWIIGVVAVVTLSCSLLSIYLKGSHINLWGLDPHRALIFGNILFAITLLLGTATLIAPTNILQSRKLNGTSWWMDMPNIILACAFFAIVMLTVLAYTPQSLGGMAQEKKKLWVSPDAAKVLITCADPKEPTPKIDMQEPTVFNYSVLHTNSTDTMVWCGPTRSTMTVSNSFIIARQ